MHDERIFHLWSNGRTGYPLIDACMRELSITGYASNHARLNAASFLAYTMSFDWRCAGCKGIFFQGRRWERQDAQTIVHTQYRGFSDGICC